MADHFRGFLLPILLLPLFCAGLAYLFTTFQPKSYASTLVIGLPERPGSLSTQRLLTDNGIFQSFKVIQPAVQKLRERGGPLLQSGKSEPLSDPEAVKRFRKHLHVRISDKEHQIRITTMSPDPAESRYAAIALGDSYWDFYTRQSRDFQKAELKDLMDRAGKYPAEVKKAEPPPVTAAKKAKSKPAAQGSTAKNEKLQIQKKEYASLLKKIERLNLLLASTPEGIRIVEEAQEPSTPFRPNLKLNLLIGALGGLVLGISLVLFSLRQRKKTSDGL
jgi:hypothetical protein